jgi:hypothetical protein
MERAIQLQNEVQMGMYDRGAQAERQALVARFCARPDLDSQMRCRVMRGRP